MGFDARDPWYNVSVIPAYRRALNRCRILSLPPAIKPIEPFNLPGDGIRAFNIGHTFILFEGDISPY